MARSHSEATSPAADGHAAHTSLKSWVTRLVLLMFVGFALVIAYAVAVTIVPREWAQWVGNRVDGQLMRGFGLGLVFGFLFTLLPLTLLRQTLRYLSWGLRAVLALLAAVLALPNLLTLGIVIGTGKAAHAGERILDVDGPGFRSGTLVGAVIAALIGVTLFAFAASRARSLR